MAIFGKTPFDTVDSVLRNGADDAARIGAKAVVEFTSPNSLALLKEFSKDFDKAVLAGDVDGLISLHKQMKTEVRKANLPPEDVDRLTDNSFLANLRPQALRHGLENELFKKLEAGEPVDLDDLAIRYEQTENTELLKTIQEALDQRAAIVASVPSTPVQASFQPVNVAPAQPQMGGSNNSGFQQQQASNGGGGNNGGFGSYQAPPRANAFQSTPHTPSGFGTYQAPPRANAFEEAPTFKVTSTSITTDDFVIPPNKPTWLHKLVEYGDVKSQIQYHITGTILKPPHKNIINFDAEHKYVRPAVKEIDRVGMDTGFSQEVLKLQRRLFDLTERLRTNPAGAPLGKDQFVTAVKKELSDFVKNADNRRMAESFIQGLDPLKQELNAKLTGRLGNKELPDDLKAMKNYWGPTSGLYKDQIKEIQSQIADLEDTALRLTDENSDFVDNYTKKIENLVSSGLSRDDIAQKVNTFLIGVAADNLPTVGSRLGRVGSEIVMCSTRIQPFMPIPNISGQIPKDYAELTQLVDNSSMSKGAKEAYKENYVMWDQELRSREKILTVRSYSPYDRIDPVTNTDKSAGNREKHLLTLEHEWQGLTAADQGEGVGKSKWDVTAAGKWFSMLESAYNEGYGHNALELMERLREAEGVGDLSQETFPRHIRGNLETIINAEAKDPDKALWAKAIRTVMDSPIQGPDSKGVRDTTQRVTSKVTSFEFMRTLAGSTSTLKIPFVDEPIPISKPIYLRVKYAPWQNYIKPVMSQMQRAWLTGGELGPPKPEDVTAGIQSIKYNGWFRPIASPLPEGAKFGQRLKENLFGEDSIFNRAPSWLKAPARILSLGLFSNPASTLSTAGLNTEMGRKFWKTAVLSTGLITAGTYGIEYGTAAADLNGFDNKPGWNIGINPLKPVVRAGVGVSDFVLDDWAGGVSTIYSKLYKLKFKDDLPVLSFDIGGTFDEADKAVSDWIDGRPSGSTTKESGQNSAPEESEEYFFQPKRLKGSFESSSIMPQPSNLPGVENYNITSVAFNDSVLNAKQITKITQPALDLDNKTSASTLSLS